MKQQSTDYDIAASALSNPQDLIINAVSLLGKAENLGIPHSDVMMENFVDFGAREGSSLMLWISRATV